MPPRRNSARPLRWVQALTATALVFTGCAMAQQDEQQARELIKTYIERHNSHDLEGVMALYAEDAVFHLSMGRPAIIGRDAIRELERFDVAAGSTIYPRRITVEPHDGRWRVHIGGAVEHSAIFAASGVSIVMAQPIRDAFVLEHGRIATVRQPDLEPSCTRIVLGAFRSVVAWLTERNDQRQTQLVANNFIVLTPATIPDVVDVIHEWRAESGWSPNRHAVSACARFKP